MSECSRLAYHQNKDSMLSARNLAPCVCFLVCVSLVSVHQYLRLAVVCWTMTRLPQPHCASITAKWMICHHTINCGWQPAQLCPWEDSSLRSVFSVLVALLILFPHCGCAHSSPGCHAIGMPFPLSIAGWDISLFPLSEPDLIRSWVRGLQYLNRVWCETVPWACVIFTLQSG